MRVQVRLLRKRINPALREGDPSCRVCFPASITHHLRELELTFFLLSCMPSVLYPFCFVLLRELPCLDIDGG